MRHITKFAKHSVKLPDGDGSPKEGAVPKDEYENPNFEISWNCNAKLLKNYLRWQERRTIGGKIVGKSQQL